MIEFLCKTKNKTYRRIVRVHDIIEIMENDKGNAEIRTMRGVSRTRCWIETAESYNEVKAKLMQAK